MKYKKPILSIIVPVYNVEKYLSRCIDSILSQSFTDFELILVDDGSTDSSGNICDKYKQEDERVNVIHGENKGQGSARNIGLDICRGQYISFVDSDDWISKDFYNSIEYLEKDPTIDFVSHPIRFVNENGDILDYENLSSRHVLSKKEAFELWIGKAGTVRGYVWQNIYRSRVFSNLRFENRVYEDCIIQSEILSSVSHIYICSDGFYNYLQRMNSITNTGWTGDKVLADLDATILYLENCVRFDIDKALLINNIVMLISRAFTNNKRFRNIEFDKYYKKIYNLIPSVFSILTTKLELYVKIKILLYKIFSIRILSKLAIHL